MVRYSYGHCSESLLVDEQFGSSTNYELVILRLSMNRENSIDIQATKHGYL